MRTDQRSHSSLYVWSLLDAWERVGTYHHRLHDHAALLSGTAMTLRNLLLSFLVLNLTLGTSLRSANADNARSPGRYNVLFIISDDLTLTALSCYGNKVCQTPNIDRLAARGTRYTRAYCQGTYCGPSRASFMSGYYPHATGMLGYKSPRPAIGDRAMWAQHFKNAGYYTARVSKIFHMGVPGGIEQGTDGADDPACWTERFNSQGPEWKAPGDGETLEGNPDGKKPVVGGNTFVVVEADGDDLVHSDGRTAKKACELIAKHKDETFFLGVGFVRPHVPFVAPRRTTNRLSTTKWRSRRRSKATGTTFPRPASITKPAST